VENIVNGLVSNDPSVVNDPDLAPYRRENDQGNTYIDVDGLRSQDAVTRVLYEKYGIDVESWATNYLTGMHTGDITPAGR
jgi:PKD repeat protein